MNKGVLKEEIVKGLSDRQKEAVECEKRHIRIIAGAGAGMTKKAEKLGKEKLIDTTWNGRENVYFIKPEYIEPAKKALGL